MDYELPEPSPMDEYESKIFRFGYEQGKEAYKEGRMELKDIRVGAMIITSKLEYDYDPARWEAYAENYLRLQVANFIQGKRSEMIKTDTLVEKRIDLYVASPNDFWGIVQKEAENIAMRFIKNINPNEATKTP